MYYSNIHTHTTYCDGHNSVEEIVLEAIKLGMKTIGISTHGPLPFEVKFAIKHSQIESYINDVNNMKEKYRNEIEVLLGMELDYFVNTEFSHIDKEMLNKLDYVIGSVHYLGKYENSEPWAVDSGYEKVINGINKDYAGDVKKAVCDYYMYLGKMVKKYKPTVVGHMDLFKKNNKNNILFNEDEVWYHEAVNKCLDEIQSTDSVIEINTGAIARGFTDVQYPSAWILEQANQRNIPITINSDAHSAEKIACEFDNMYKLVKKLEIKNVVYLTKDGWKKII